MRNLHRYEDNATSMGKDGTYKFIPERYSTYASLTIDSSKLRVWASNQRLQNTNHIYSIPHLPYNGGFQFAGVNLQIIFQFDTKKNKKKQEKHLFGRTEEKKEEI